ncbi:MAG: glycosyltransferase family 2 protein [Clostridium sp.]|uniref:glycosyltransferase family 2 protein n=1 Tax=Clostridium sp. TaxID=1506 RepID=UPI003F339649
MDIYKLSVIIPVYNVKSYIIETLESLYNQTLKEFELILIDDGSTDGTYEILKEYEKKYENIKLIKQENSGPSIARNKGLKIATGEYIVFVDSDDLLPEDSLEYRYNIAKEKDSDVVICGTAKTDDGETMKPIQRHMFEEGYRELGKDSDILWALGPCNKIFKKEILKDLYFPENINYAEDQVFMIHAFLNAKKIYATPKVVYYYRMRNTPGESLTQQVDTNSANVLKQVCEVWKISVNLINEKVKDKDIAYNIKGNYFYRLMIIDIWPPLNKVFKSGDKKAEVKSLESLNELMKYVSDKELEKIGKLKQIPFKKIIKNDELTDVQKIKKIRHIMFIYKCIIKFRQITRI